MKNREFKKGMLAGAAVVLAVGGIGYQGVSAIQYEKDSVLSDSRHTDKIKYLEKLIDECYLEEKDEEALAEGMYAGLIAGLKDPYSRYYTAKEYQEETTVTDGAYVGIGVQLMKDEDGKVRVMECYEGGPGEKAGIRKGDFLTAVNGMNISEYSVDEVADMIRKSDGGSVVLTIEREQSDTLLDIPVTLEDVRLPSVFHEMLDKKTGYIQIAEFSGVTYEQYMEAFEDLQNQGMGRLIIDLRDNPGGLLNAVCDILEEILPEGLIVYMEDKYGNREEHTCKGEHPLDIPLAVLVNEESASASEIFAGAVQDYGIGTIVGVRTYGKGVVQSIHELNDGSAVKLTVSKYYTPNGNDIHKVGIQPDVEVELDPELRELEEYSREQDNQLQKALEVLDMEEAF